MSFGKITTFFGSLLIVFALPPLQSHAEEVGGIYKFQIPPRPVGSAKAHEIALRIQTELGPNSNRGLRESSFRRCPKFSSLLFRIYDRLIEANNLQEFALHGSPGLRLEAGCLTVLPTGTGNGANSNSFGITIPASVSIWANTDDEIAFVLAHEMAHLILGHNEISSESNFEGIQKLEHDADQLATLITANAGYDPAASSAAFCASTKFKSSLPWLIPCALLGSSGAGSDHGSNLERRQRVASVLDTIGYTRFPRRSFSPDFPPARLESEQTASEILANKAKRK